MGYDTPVGCGPYVKAIFGGIFLPRKKREIWRELKQNMSGLFFYITCIIARL
jgi:hypothetical protein